MHTVLYRQAMLCILQLMMKAVLEHSTVEGL